MKCASLSMINRLRKKYVEPFSPTIGGSQIPALKWDERYKYLGIYVGRERALSFPDLEKTILEQAQKISRPPSQIGKKLKL